MDAVWLLELLVDGAGGFGDEEWPLSLDLAVAHHASPPCPLYSKTHQIARGNHPDLVCAVRELLKQTGLPYVIENVKGAPLRNPQMLEGQMFGLNTHRPGCSRRTGAMRLRTFAHPLHARPRWAAGQSQEKRSRSSATSPTSRLRKAIGMTWMSAGRTRPGDSAGDCEAIGADLLAEIEARKAVAA